MISESSAWQSKLSLPSPADAMVIASFWRKLEEGARSFLSSSAKECVTSGAFCCTLKSVDLIVMRPGPYDTVL